MAFAIHQEEKECPFASVIVEACFADEELAGFVKEMVMIAASIEIASSIADAFIIASFATEASSVFTSCLASASLVIPSFLAALISQGEFRETFFAAEDKEVSIASC